MKRINWRKWLDGFSLAGEGVWLAMRTGRFWSGFLVAFLFFGTLINLLSGGVAKFQLMGTVGLVGSLKIIGSAVAGVFGYKMIFAEWLPVFLLSTMQGVLIGLIVLIGKKKRSADGIEKAGIVAGLIALGAGCPTCGTTLIAPLLGAVFSAGGVAVAGAVSGAMTALAVVVGILALRRLGEEAYVIMTNEKYLKRKKEEREKSA